MTTQQKNKLLKTIKLIIDEASNQILWFVKNQNSFKEMSGGLLFANNQHLTFREALALVYLTGRNEGILQEVSADTIFKLLDEGVINEHQLDLMVGVMYETL
jgi:hypothetical protein